jgi:tetratricopeptide (TPR) repeat protein
LVTAGAVLALVVSVATAQDDFGGWANDPNSEPGDNEQLFDRTDSGNVAQQAQMAYAAGMRELKAAAKLEGKLPTLEGKKKESAEKKIGKAYERAANSFQNAIRTNPKMIEAYSGLSRAFRASGKFAESLQVSASGLKLNPNDDACFEGWAESIMGFFNDTATTEIYTRLQETNPARAETLMGVMKGWLVEHQADPGDLAPEAITRLEEWIAEQESAT